MFPTPSKGTLGIMPKRASGATPNRGTPKKPRVSEKSGHKPATALEKLLAKSPKTTPTNKDIGSNKFG